MAAAIAIVLAIVSGVIAYRLGQKSTGDLARQTEIETKTIETTGEKLTWQFSTAGTAAEPKTNVSLIRASGFPYDLGSYAGNCVVTEESAWKLEKGEKTGAICWFAGGGDEIGVFEEKGKLMVRSRTLDEGTAENPGVKGEWKEVLEIPL